MEMRLVEHFADEFNKQLGNGVDVRKFPKAMAKLKKQVKRTKEILSANTAAPISVESLHDDRDFRYNYNLSRFLYFPSSPNFGCKSVIMISHSRICIMIGLIFVMCVIYT